MDCCSSNTYLVYGLIAILSYIIYNYIKGWQTRPNLPPGPPPCPIFGNKILFKKDPLGYKRLTELSKQYGSVYRLYCGSTIIVFLNGYDAIHEAFVKQAAVFTDRPQLFAPLIGVSKGTGITYNSDHNWKTLRRFTLQALRDFGVGKKSLEEQIVEEVDVVADTLKTSNGEPIRVKPLLLSAATNIICSVMFGERFSYENSRFTELTGVLEEIFRLNAPFAKENFFPITRLFPSGRELIRRRSAAIEKVKRYLARTIKEHEETFDSNNIRDFIDLYHKVSMDESEPEIFTEANIYKVIVDLFLAGGETTGTSLDWSLLYMIRYPNIQRKCQAEIDKVVGTNRRVKLSDKGSLPFLEATLLEIQRIGNTLTFSLPHVAKTDATLQGYLIPKDSIVIANLYSAHIDEKYWDEPETFRPERFLDSDGKIQRKDAFVPFSTGPRFCIGEPLARMELFLFFTNLLQQFSFTPTDENDLPSLDGIQALTLTALPYHLVAKPR
ncbi:CYP2K [Mytilus edulis]|uniref:CYP2K n=1 Tax=Mytilus edulis TaxID=6550 RepID=A0A8S3UDX4_MYTED|nr:CYP2K [Mytilus edulis]